MDALKSLEQAQKAYWDQVGAIADRVRTELVIPFCDRKGWRFVAGMGTWNFVKPKAKGHEGVSIWDEPTDAEGRRRFGVRLWNALQADVISGQSLGSLIPDYTPPGYE